jgi:3'-phosphoadenosine 5'-phosphosulfate sulfotransferase (PAPS reductase)/FAD synthetase
MLWRILQAHGGTLPEDVHVCFANTGKEREETLRFVHDCATNWGVRVRWLEFVTNLASVGPEGRFVEVGFNSASRKGEPFDRLIERKQALPSNLTGRWCTSFLKILVMSDFMQTLGFEPGEYVERIGLRADESDRVTRNTAQAKKHGRKTGYPLSTAGVRKADILAFWKQQPFDLMLGRGYGNCDHCPFVGDKSRIARARHDPAGVEWWARHEMARKFRMGRTFSFVEILGLVAQSPVFEPMDDADSECGAFCIGEAA